MTGNSGRAAAVQKGTHMPPTDPERDPLFRGIVILLAVAVVLMLGVDAFSKAKPDASASTAGITTPAPTMKGMSGGNDSTDSMSAEEMAAMHEKSMKAFPASTQGLGNQVLQPEIVDGVKVFRLMATPVQWEVAPGKTVTAMAFNEQVPGPQIQVHQGDTVRVILTNHLTQPTTIHWHGLTVPNAMDGVPYITQDPVMPGQDFTYEFKVVDPPGTYLYHSHFNSTEQVGDGLYGAFVIEPEHTSWDVEYTEILNDGALGFTMDGKGWPATAPMTATLGQIVLIRLANVGQMLHPLHMHGYHFTVVAQDGAPVQQPYSVDTLVIAPGETYDVLVQATNSGVWAFHCHILSHVEGPQGMFGMATALIVQP
jgi:FtsP/CotA-like multicopper oxidase with cupredoxin domain